MSIDKRCVHIEVLNTFLVEGLLIAEVEGSDVTVDGLNKTIPFEFLLGINVPAVDFLVLTRL